MKQKYILTREDYCTLLKCSDPAPYLAVHCGAPLTPQQRANAIWRALGQKMGFDYNTVEPSDEGERVFYAEPSVEYDGDGNQITAIRHDFVDLQNSPAGFGDTEEDAYADLVSQEDHYD